MKLSIVIPAYNEEAAIGSIIDRCLAARAHITQNSGVDDVEIIVVSDGSTDRTVSIARQYEDIRLIVFEHNRGYGAAIKQGFEESDGDLVGFLDADGTCDPNFFVELCRAIAEENASVAIGSRLGPQSEMPTIRRIGNRGYAFLLSLLSNQVVTDTASGMRVIRRDVLRRLYPLPDGLHFTPAMSARVLMDSEMTIVERPMSYRERVGQSKLNVLHDGVRFLRTILEMTMMWRPAKLFMVGAVILFSLTVLLAMHPVEMWLRTGGLREDMIYRLLFCSLLGTSAATLLSAGVIADHIRGLLDQRPAKPTFAAACVDGIFSVRGLAVILTVATPMLIWLIGRGVMTRVAYGYVDLHWSRVVLAGLIAFGAFQVCVATLIVNTLRFHARRKIAAQRTTTRSLLAQGVGQIQHRQSARVLTPHQSQKSP